MSRTRAPTEFDIDTVELTEDGDWVVAKAAGTNIASQGKTVPEALTNLAEALELHTDGVPEDIEAPEPDAPWFDSE
jgi:predicted RNase H-like HicB family nuclease